MENTETTKSTIEVYEMKQDTTLKVAPKEEKPKQEAATPPPKPDDPDEIAVAGYETINYLIQRGLLEKRL
ncbi:hypothetical protein M0P48_03425 [Candidatus Gracilibacteria bacterium]|nr:hypothetical protein [Candidatus Gracilibacteria bacterium]